MMEPVDNAEQQAERLEETRDPKTSTTVVVGVIGIVLLLVCIIATQALYYSGENREAALKIYAGYSQELAQLQTAQIQELNSPPRWLDQDQGVVAIPIQRAMELVVTEMKAGRRPSTMSVQEPAASRPAGSGNVK